MKRRMFTNVFFKKPSVFRQNKRLAIHSAQRPAIILAEVAANNNLVEQKTSPAAVGWNKVMFCRHVKSCSQQPPHVTRNASQTTPI